MASKTSIDNLALRHLASSKSIANHDTTASADATACRIFYDIALEETFRDFSWPFATEIGDLGLVEEDPNDEWAYAYRYPSDCKFFRRILSGTRNDSRQSRVPYRITQDDQGLLILTDTDEAQGEWTIMEEDASRYPADFVMALSLLLAAYIAPSVTAGDPFKLGERAYRLYVQSIAKARANAFNEQQDEEPPQSEFIAGREA